MSDQIIQNRNPDREPGSGANVLRMMIAELQTITGSEIVIDGGMSLK